MEEDAAEDVSTSDQPEDKSEIPEDRYENRNYKDDLVGRKVTALYENGWFTGSVMCFIMLNELRVNYADGTWDFLSTDDFVKVILEPGCIQ